MKRTSTPGLTALVLLAAGASLTAAPAARAAKRLEPPTLMMMNRYQQVAVAVAASSPAPGKVLFRRKARIYGETPRRVVARLDPETIEQLAWGERYVLAWTEIRRNPKDRDSPEIDPEGPKVVKLPVIGPALLEDTPEVRFLFEAARDRQPGPGRTYLEALLTQLGRADARTRRFVIAELYLRPALAGHVQEADLPGIRSAMTDETIDTESRSFLLEVASRFPAVLRDSWLAEAARGIVADADTELDLDSTHPLLVKTALTVLETAGSAADAELVARQLDSNSPGVAKAALATLQMLDLDAAARRAREVLGRNDLHQTTRQALQSFLEQYAKGQSSG